MVPAGLARAACARIVRLFSGWWEVCAAGEDAAGVDGQIESRGRGASARSAAARAARSAFDAALGQAIGLAGADSAGPSRAHETGASRTRGACFRRGCSECGGCSECTARNTRGNQASGAGAFRDALNRSYG